MKDPRQYETRVWHVDDSETWWEAYGPFVVAILLAVAVAGLTSLCAQWGTRSVGAVAPLVRNYENTEVRNFNPKLEWHKDRSAPGQIDLMRDGRMVGAYDVESGIYRRLVNYRRGLWSEPEALPDNVPLPPGGLLEQVVENFGVDLDKLHAEADGYKIGGRKVTKEEAYEAIEKGLPDDAHKTRVTVIGTDEDRKRFEQAFRASDIASACVLWSVPPDHWSLKDIDTKTTVFKVDGKPTIYAQAPDGKVLWRQDDDAGAIENLRKVNKPYDPKKDPGPNAPVVPGLPAGIPWPLVAVGGVMLVAFLMGRRQQSQV